MPHFSICWSGELFTSPFYQIDKHHYAIDLGVVACIHLSDLLIINQSILIKQTNNHNPRHHINKTVITQYRFENWWFVCLLNQITSQIRCITIPKPVDKHAWPCEHCYNCTTSCRLSRHCQIFKPLPNGDDQSPAQTPLTDHVEGWTHLGVCHH